MVEIQNNACAICDREFTKIPQVDHDHKTLRVRGALCVHCNYRLLGRGLDNPERHERAAAYLRSDFDARNL